jgi:aryl-alcohol dehydrogenase-like predicted oxidoreductase
MNREAEELITYMGSVGVGVVARECLANGFLSGKIKKDTVFPENNLNNRYSRDEISERVDYVESLKFLVRDDIADMPQAALRWVLNNHYVSTALAGSRNQPEIESCAQASIAAPYSVEEMKRSADLHKKDFPAA